MAAGSGDAMLFRPSGGLRGSLQVPADKSISHRAALIAAISDGPVEILNFLEAADTHYTLEALAACGVGVEDHGGGTRMITGVGLRGFRQPETALDLGNSGTTIRLLPGILAGQDGRFTLDGDESLRRRPMDRVVEPLRLMGVEIEAREGRYAPLVIEGGDVRAAIYEMPMASAQVKSAILLAGLYADAPTEVTEPSACRDHTEIMLANAGASLERKGLRTIIYPADFLQLESVAVPGDFSSAAFLLLGATIIPGSQLELPAVGVNPTRTGLLDILVEMGADITLEHTHSQAGEPVADITVQSASLSAVEVGAEISGRTIDELPLVALAAAFADGDTTVRGASELRHKESDRISSLIDNLSALGVHIEMLEDGFRVRGGPGILGGTCNSLGDHRMAMLGAVAGLASRAGVKVRGYGCVDVSFPGFREALAAVEAGRSL